MRHLQRRRANIHAIEKSKHVEQEEERKEPPRDAVAGTLGNLRLGTGCHGGLAGISDRGHEIVVKKVRGGLAKLSPRAPYVDAGSRLRMINRPRENNQNLYHRTKKLL
jgi:hypothetical protein